MRCCHVMLWSLRKSLSKMPMAVSTKAVPAGTQLRHKCEFAQAEKERKELHTQFKALHQDKFVPQA